MMDFADQLKAERKRLGLTQAQAVAMLRDVSRSWYEKAETKKRVPHKWMQAEALRRLRAMSDDMDETTPKTHNVESIHTRISPKPQNSKVQANTSP